MGIHKLVAGFIMAAFCINVAAIAEDAPSTESMLDLVRKNEYKSAWAGMFHGEWSVPQWIQDLDATGGQAKEIEVDGKKYLYGAIIKANDPSDRVLVVFNSEHKKCWGLEVTVPAGLGPDGAAHPKRYANLRYYGTPDGAMKKVLSSQLEKDPSWK